MASPGAPHWSFHDDPRVILPQVAALIASDPLQYTMLSGWGRRECVRLDSGVPRSSDQPYWYAVHRRGDGVVDAAAMRTHPGHGHPLWVPAMPETCADALAEALLERDEVVGTFGVNGMLPAARRIAERLGEATGRQVRESVRTRLFRLDELQWPAEPQGSLRYAVTDDLDVVTAWLDRFAHDADEQAGRTAGHAAGVLSRDEVRRRILDGHYRVWLDPQGQVVHLTGAAPVHDAVAGIGPVFTPAEHRGHGYAGWVVATCSAEVLAAGAIPFLFTDQANPVSNRLYESLGYRMVADSVELALA